MPLILILDFTPNLKSEQSYRYSNALKWLFYLHEYVDLPHGAIEIFLWKLIEITTDRIDYIFKHLILDLIMFWLL